jgi:hypothetical protein
MPWTWPWGLVPSDVCPDTYSDVECRFGDTISESLKNAEGCAAAAPSGSCALRHAELQTVFSLCELAMHEVPNEAKTIERVRRELSHATADFGSSVERAAWCLDPSARAEALRLKHAP